MKNKKNFIFYKLFTNLRQKFNDGVVTINNAVGSKNDEQ